MGSICCCFHVPEVEQNDESNHGNCICPSCFTHNLKTKYGALFGRVEMHAAPSHATAASSSSTVALNNPQLDSRRHLLNINPILRSGLNMQLGSNDGATLKERQLEPSKKFPGKVLMELKEHVSSITEEEDVCPVCLEEFIPDNPKITTQCSHNYHLSCMYEWLERSEKCPLCAKTEKD